MAMGFEYNPTEGLFHEGGIQDENATTVIMHIKPEEAPDYYKTDIPIMPKNIPVDRESINAVAYEWTLMRNLAIAIWAFPGLKNALTEIIQSEDN